MSDPEDIDYKRDIPAFKNLLCNLGQEISSKIPCNGTFPNRKWPALVSVRYSNPEKYITLSYQEETFNACKLQSSRDESNKDNMRPKFKAICEHIEETLSQNIKNNIDGLWKVRELDVLIEQLVQKENTAITKEPAWRPTTGDVNLKPMYEVQLLSKKKLLRTELQSLDRDIEKLEHLYNNSCKNLKQFDNKLTTATNETEDFLNNFNENVRNAN